MTSGEVMVGVEASVVFVEAGFVAVGFVAIGFVEVVFVVGLVKDSGALSSGVAGTVAGAGGGGSRFRLHGRRWRWHRLTD